jgi:hypothetical protein
MNHALAAQAWPWHLGDSSWHYRERNNNQFWSMCCSSRGTQEPNATNLMDIFLLYDNPRPCINLWTTEAFRELCWTVFAPSTIQSKSGCQTSIYLFHWKIPFTEDYAGELVGHLHDIHIMSDNTWTSPVTRWKLGTINWPTPQGRKGKSPKLQSSWEGPYKVVTWINDVVYRI